MNENTEGGVRPAAALVLLPDGFGLVARLISRIAESFTTAWTSFPISAARTKQLIDNETRLMQHADVIFTGGYEMGEKRKKLHPNVHIFGCGVEFDHFNKAADPTTIIPPDIDFMGRPILGWFGVVDERVDYAMLGEIARMRPEWSIAMVGPVVKVDPNLLPHSPNLFWMGGRDYQQLPNYCGAFDICLMPFAMNASTQYINPTKGLEYMATGKPVISTARSRRRSAMERYRLPREERRRVRRNGREGAATT